MIFSARHHRTFERLEPRRLLAGDLTLVRYFDLWEGGIIPSTDVAGITYHEPSGHLFISDSEINELDDIFDGNNVFEISLAGDQLFQSFVTNNSEPTGIAYGPDDQGVGSFYLSNDNSPKNFRRYDETFSAPLATVYTSDDVSSATDPEGLSVDPVTGDIYVVDGESGGVQVLRYDASLTFQSVFSIADRLSDAEGAAFDPRSGHLFVVSGSDQLILEYTVDGQYVDEYDISGFSTSPESAQALAFAPTSDPNDDPGALALYIADGGVDNFPDGRVFETLLPDLDRNRAPVLDPIDDQTVASGDELTLTATAFDPDVPTDTLTFSLDAGAPAAAVLDPATGGFRWTPDTPGNYSVTVRVTDDGAPALSDTETFSIVVYDDSAEVGTVQRRVEARSDDAEQRAEGKVDLNSSDLEFVLDKTDQIVGMRFNTLTIPQGATILDAYIQFQVDEVNTTPTDLIIRAEDVDHAATFTIINGNIGSRPMTDAYAAWSPPVWDAKGAAGEDQRTPSLVGLVQEVVDRPGWTIGNSMAIIISGTGERTGESYEGKPEAAPLLYVEYQIGGGNRPPVAHPDAITVLEGATVALLDDGAASLLENDTDANLPDDSLSVDLAPVVAPLHGQVTLHADGTFSYTHDGSENLADSFTYRVRDESGSTATAVVSITITAVNDHAPVAHSDAATAFLGGTVTALDSGAASLLANDTDGDLPRDTLTVTTTPVVAPSHGSLTLNSDGTFSYTHDASDNYADQFVYEVRDASGGANPPAMATVSITIDPSVAVPVVVQVRVASSTDDAEENASGRVGLTSSDLELVYDKSNQTVGIRFADVDIPRNATILKAYVQFQADETSSDPTTLNIHGESVDNALAFTSTAWNISLRDKTAATVSWSPPSWTSRGEADLAQQTPDLTAIIQEIVNRAGWRNDNALALIITGTGRRVTESYNGDDEGAPLLYVEYAAGTGTTTNRAPTASDDSADTTQNVPVTVDVLANDTDAEDDPLMIAIVDATNGTALVNHGDTPDDPTDDVVQFTPDVDFFGTAVFTYRVNDGELDSNLARVTVSVAPTGGSAGVLDIRVADRDDDAEEEGTGNVDLHSSDLELGVDHVPQLVGMRFVGVDLPRTAIVTNAYIQFQVDETDSATTALTIRGEAVGDAQTFLSTDGSMRARPTTTASVSWSPDPWTVVGEAGLDQRTPDIAAVVQEIIAHPDWVSGNALAILIDGSGTRTAESYDGIPEAAPLLHVEYMVPAAVTLESRGPALGPVESLTEAQLMSIIDVAAMRLDPRGETALWSILADLAFELVDLPDNLLGRTFGNSIQIDIDAAGHGWFVDPTPWDEREFHYHGRTASLLAMPNSPAAGRADLLTVVMHELGHVLGHQHETSVLMEAMLPLGTRRLIGKNFGELDDEPVTLGPAAVDSALRDEGDHPFMSAAIVRHFL